ncbi:hypothetical protein [Rhodococcus sp. NPDC047139]
MFEQSSGAGSPAPVSSTLHQGVRFSTAEIKKRIGEMFDDAPALAVPSEN